MPKYIPYKATAGVIFAFGDLGLGVDLIDSGITSGNALSPISYKLDGPPETIFLKLNGKIPGFYEEFRQ